MAPTSLVACPGRLEDLIRQRHCRLDRVEVTVVDEADLMADLGFLPAVQRLLDQTPKGGQRLLFSATLDHGIDGLVRRYLNDPVTHAVDARRAHRPSSTITCSPFRRATSLRSCTSSPPAISERSSSPARSTAPRSSPRGSRRPGIPTTELHGNLAQAARERNLAAFANGSARVLVATDIAVARHPRRRHRARGPRRPAGRAQGVPPPLGTHCACRRLGRSSSLSRRPSRSRACMHSLVSPCPPDDHQGHPGARVARRSLSGPPQRLRRGRCR